MRPRPRWWMLLPVLGMAAFLATAAMLRFSLDMPVSSPAPAVVVDIPPRATLREVGSILEKSGVVPGRWIFILWVRLLGLEGSLRYGEYSFSGPQSVKTVIDVLVSGRTSLHRVTIPEGFTVQQVARRLEELGLGSSEEILKASTDPRLLSRLGVPGPSLEGFCFPDTYLFPRDWPAEKVLEKMVNRFWEVYDARLRQRVRDMGLTMLEAVTLASIIEKECGDVSELPLISAVFHNRLKKDIPLMADPAVIYGLAKFDGNLRKTDLKTPGPYNLYLKKGLPPGPISNPGLPALRAALYPASVDFLFFVSKNNGTHEFSRSLAEHNRAVDLYQRSAN